VVAYADDITLFVTDPRGIPYIADLLRSYKGAIGESLNIPKSKAKQTVSWDTTINMMDIPYCSELTILGYYFTNTVAQSGKASWTKVTGKVRAMASMAYCRDLCLMQRIQFVHSFLLAKIWPKTQIYPPPTKETLRQIVTAIAGFILKGAILRVLLSTLQRQTDNGGLNLIDNAAKCTALFLSRL
jgi:hypothetical protein